MRVARLAAVVAALIVCSCTGSARPASQARPASTATSASSLYSTTTTPRDRSAQPITSVRVLDDTHLSIDFELPMCAAAAGYDLASTQDRVTIWMLSVPPPPGCLGGLGSGKGEVVLAEPLRGRKLVDGACLPNADYAGSSTCAAGFSVL